MRRIVLFALCCAACFVMASELPVTRMKKPVTEGFGGFVGTYGSLPVGFSVSKDGSTLLAATNSLDFRGIHSGGTVEGSCLAWDRYGGNYALGYQPTEAEFTPGYFLLVLSNSTGSAIGRVDVSYEVTYYNNENRGSSLALEYSPNGTSFVSVAGSVVTTPQVEDASPSWTNVARSCQLTFKPPVQDGSLIWIRWMGDDAGGSGSRDEYGIDNVSIVARPPGGTVISVR